MTERTMRLWIGVFVVAALVLLAALIILFGSAPTLFKRSILYTVRFPDAPNVTPGTPVRRSGVHIGEVRQVILDNEEGDVRVVLAIDPQNIIRYSDEARLITGLLGSDTSIDFVPRPKPELGQPPLDRAPVPPGTVLLGVRQPTVNTVLDQASGVVPVAQDTLNEIKKSLQRLEKIAPIFEDTLKEYRELARAGREAVPGLNKTSDEFRELAKSLREAVPGLSMTSDEFREFAKAYRLALPNLTSTSDMIRKFAADADKALPDLQSNVGDVGDAARAWRKVGDQTFNLIQDNQAKAVKALDNLNEVLTRLGSTLSDANQTNLAEFLKNLRLGTADLESIARNLDEVTREGRTTVRQFNETLKTADDTLKAVQAPLKGLDNDRISNITRNLDESMDKINRMLCDVREIVRVVGQADGTVSRFLTDPTIYNRVDEVLCLITKMVPRVEHLLKDFETFADKLARHPELIGVGGAVRPSSGLKDAPSTNSSYYPHVPVGPVPPR